MSVFDTNLSPSSPTSATPAEERFAITQILKSSHLSKRGEAALIRPPLLKCALFENAYCPNRNANGLINLGVAENSLKTNWLIEYFTKNFKLDYTDFTYGTKLSGSTRLFKALAHLFSTYFGARLPVLENHIVAGTGCGSVIDLLVSCLADPGDGILVSRPYYNGFSASFACRNAVQSIGVECLPGTESETEALLQYEKTLIESEKNGIKIRAVILANPHNPLGFTYSKETLLAYCAFAEKYDIHLISDEIYALSVFSTPDWEEAKPFVSLLSIDPSEVGCDPSRLHVIYGASKDFGANGLRIGALISQSNPALKVAMESSCLLMKISSPADALWSGLLLDPVALPEYLNLNQTILASAYAFVEKFLKFHKIEYRRSNAGHFIFIDLRRFLPIHDSEGIELTKGFSQEDELADRFMKAGVNLGRGAAYSNPVPGYFRLTFTLRRDYLETGLGRIEKVLGLEETKIEGDIRVIGTRICEDDLVNGTKELII